MKRDRTQIDRINTLPNYLHAPQLIFVGAINYQFGNRIRYNSNFDKWNDPRISLLDLKDFSSKRVLDIGCSQGSLTLQIGVHFKPQKIQGVDLDEKLIRLANKNLKFFSQASLLRVKPRAQQIFDKKSQDELAEVRKKKIQQLAKKLKSLPLCFKLNLPKMSAFGLEQPAKQQFIQNFKYNINRDLTSSVVFKVENYLSRQPQFGLYDTIVCFKVVKWIHLNFGDVAIIRLFSKCYTQLRQGGRLYLQFHQWPSYKRKKSLCPKFKENFKNIELRPNKFQKYLTDLGFIVQQRYEPSLQIRDPLIILRKDQSKEFALN